MKISRFVSLSCSLLAATAAFVAVSPASAQVLPVINEFVLDHTGSDSKEFVEIFGAPNTDYSSLTVVEIEGDSGSTGLVDDYTFAVGTTDANGYWVSPFESNAGENGTVTLLLVEGFSGAVGDDIDADDDGVIDNPVWTSIVDSIATVEDPSEDLAYGVALLPGFDGSTFQPGGASRIPNGLDTDSVSDWLRNDFNGEGFGDPFTGSPDIGEAINTPGAVNMAVIPEPASILLLIGCTCSLLAARR